MPLGLNEDIGNISRQSIVYETLKSAVLDGVLTVGTRLPSTRTLALRWGGYPVGQLKSFMTDYTQKDIFTDNTAPEHL